MVIISNFNTLAEELKNGNEEAASQIFDYFSPKIYHFFIARVLQKEIAEDLTQEVFLKLVKKIHMFDKSKGDFSVWLWQIAKNLLIDYYRSNKKNILLPDMEVISKITVTKEIIINNPEKQIIDEITKEIKKFDELEKDLFAMRYLSELSYREISQISGKSEASLRVAVHRLNKKIRKLVKNQ